VIQKVKIMAIGVAVANAILLVTFAERNRIDGAHVLNAAVDGATSRLRPILMTSCAMIAGMLPMAIGLGEAGSQTAPLGRAVIGGLTGATIATLIILPAIFAILRGSTRKGALHCFPLTAAAPMRWLSPVSQSRPRRSVIPLLRIFLRAVERRHRQMALAIAIAAISALNRIYVGSSTGAQCHWPSSSRLCLSSRRSR